MDSISSTVAESNTGTRYKEPLTPATAGVLGADWPRLATRAKQAEEDMREVAEGAPVASAERDVQSAARDIIETCQRSRQKTNNRRLLAATRQKTNSRRREQTTVSRTMTSQRTSSKSRNDIEMEF